MKIYSYLLFPTVLASLAFTTSVKAEEVSTKAADLMGGSNLLAQSSDPAFTPASPTLTPSTPLYTGGDVNPDLPATNYWYGSLSAGFGSQSDVDLTASIGGQVVATDTGSFDNAFSFNGAVGYQFEQFRGELEIGNRFFNVKNVSDSGITSTAILINGYYDIPTGSKLRPYVGLGFGLNVNSGKIKNVPDVGNVDIGGTSFAYQGKAGVQYEISRKGNIFAELKYGSAGGYRLDRIFVLGQGVDIDFDSSNSFGFAVGYRQGF
ncbi:MAG: P44/Msp2 family outer membrane protein [Cylindrospermopsis raciborskii KL1]|uniref:P44/Msp2 family outer membrane protein n=1 Tax=Cylindrospermopsis raciborskii TaxID=77022 RepID=UPI001A2DC516|nr:P44/Msp2 family outer membrane protein [Cylindrospermopsis raciborskii]MBG0743528.1 P44/Msp2 family outer membrane protein [Cylindrospermopsis raciborskii KL1]